jgi:hypothetical protein
VTGEVAFSDTLILTLVDTLPPVLIDFVPGNDSIIATDSVYTVSAVTNEAIDSTLLSENNFQLIEAGPDHTFDTEDDIEIVGTISFDVDKKEIMHILQDVLPKGIYKATVSGVSDLSGNFQTEAHSWMFEVRAPNEWIAEGGGSWGVAENWSEGNVRQGDILIIDIPGDPVTTSSAAGTYLIGSIFSEENLTISAGILNLVDEAIINGLFTWTGQSNLGGGGTIWANGGLTISSSGNKLLHELTLVNGGNGTWIEGSVLFQDPFSQLYNAVGATFEITNSAFVHFAGSASPAPVGVINDGAIIKNGSAEARISGMPFQNNGSLDIREGEFTVFNSRIFGKGSVTVRSDARFTFEFISSVILESPIHLEENATLGLEVAVLVSDEGIGITGNGNIEVKEGGQLNTGSTLTMNGDITAKDLSIVRSSKAYLHGTTKVETLTLEGSTAQLGGMGLVEISGDMVWDAGTMLGGGTTRLMGSLTMNTQFQQTIRDRLFEVYGDVVAEGGSLTFTQESIIHIMPGGIWTQRNEFQFNGSGVMINEGIYTKEGDLPITQNGLNLENRGIMNLDHALLRVDLTFKQTPEGILNLPVQFAPGTEASHGFLSVDTAVLDGTLNIQLAEGFVPEIGASYRIVATRESSGTFAIVNGLEIAADRKFEIEYQNRHTYLNVVAIP